MRRSTLDACPAPGAGGTCGLPRYALGLCRGHYAQQHRGVALHPLRDPDAEALAILSLRVPADVRERARNDPSGARSALERWARR